MEGEGRGRGGEERGRGGGGEREGEERGRGEGREGEEREGRGEGGEGEERGRGGGGEREGRGGERAGCEEGVNGKVEDVRDEGRVKQFLTSLTDVFRSPMVPWLSCNSLFRAIIASCTQTKRTRINGRIINTMHKASNSVVHCMYTLPRSYTA